MGSIALLALLVTGCMGTKHLSHNISDQGLVATNDDVVFPALDKAWQKGIFPNSENLAKIRAGVTKDDLYHLIGRPHFNEAHKAREWDYVMKFYGANDEVQVCQYKVIFDKDYNAQQFFWLPAACANHAKPQPKSLSHQPMPVIVAAPPALVPTTEPVAREVTNVSTDALFEFDKWRAEHMLPQGRAELDALAQKLVQYQGRGQIEIMLIGHTDFLGDDDYNLELSKARAQTVMNYLVSRGVNPSSIRAAGAGETRPTKECNTNQPRAQLIDCLQPNRRVEVVVALY